MNAEFYLPRKLPGLAPVIWEQKTDEPQQWKMLPDGHLDLIFNLGTPWRVHSEMYASRAFNPTENFCFLSGLHTHPIYVSLPYARTMGIRLKPIAAKILFNLPCNELKNWSLQGEHLFKQQMAYIEDTIRSLPDFRSRAAWLEKFIFSLLNQDQDLRQAQKISTLLDKICQPRNDGKSARIETYTGYSRMQSYRLFKTWFGLSPSQAVSLHQFVNALHRMHSGQQSLTQIAINNGFYDQPHFIRVFRQFAEMTPGQYVRQKTHLVGQLPFDSLP